MEPLGDEAEFAADVAEMVAASESALFRFGRARLVWV